MTITLYAQPYNIDAEGFYFGSADEYHAQARGRKDRYGQPVEEYEIEFIDGEEIDAALAKAWELSQCNFARFLDVAVSWRDDHKHTFIIAVGECGYDFDADSVDPLDFDVLLYEMKNLRELAEHYVDEGLLGQIPPALRFYIDLDLLARDLSVEFSEIIIAGTALVYRCW